MIVMINKSIKTIDLYVSFQCDAISSTAGAISANTDIFTVPNRETTKSNQGTLAATQTERPMNI